MKRGTRRLALLAVWTLVCVVAMRYVLKQVPWHDYATLPDGRRLEVVEYHHAVDGRLDLVTLRQGDGSPIDVRPDELARAGTASDEPRIEQGLSRIGRRFNWSAGLIGLAIFAPVPWFLGWRLKVLAAVQSIDLSLLRATIITYTGNFLNFFLVGLTGGDVVKALCVSRRTNLKHEAVTMVFFDRVLGLACMILLAGAMVLVGWRDPALSGWGLYIGTLVLVCAVAVVAYWSRWLRRVLRIDRLVEALPLSGHVRRVDQAVLAFGGDKPRVAVAVVATVGAQLFSILAVFMVARALGMTGSVVAYLVYVPLGWIVASIPISFQGLGVMEAAYIQFFVASGMGVAWQAFALAMLSRVLQIVWSLPGLPLMPVALAGAKLSEAEDAVP